MERESFTQRYPDASEARVDRYTKMLEWRTKGLVAISFYPHPDAFSDYIARVELYGQVLKCRLSDYPTEEMFAHVALAIQANGGQ